jgi:hypothetical protein
MRAVGAACDLIDRSGAADDTGAHDAASFEVDEIESVALGDAVLDERASSAEEHEDAAQ